MQLIRANLFLCAITLAYTCPTYRDLSYSDCDFYMTYTDASCTAFSFDPSQWSVCSSWNYYYDSDGYQRSYCSGYSIIQDSSWSSCTNRCCDSDASYSLSTAGLDECQAWLDARFKLALILGLSISFGILGCVGIIILIGCCLKRGCPCDTTECR